MEISGLRSVCAARWSAWEGESGSTNVVSWRCEAEAADRSQGRRERVLALRQNIMVLWYVFMMGKCQFLLWPFFYPRQRGGVGGCR